MKRESIVMYTDDSRMPSQKFKDILSYTVSWRLALTVRDNTQNQEWCCTLVLAIPVLRRLRLRLA